MPEREALISALRAKAPLDGRRDTDEGPFWEMPGWADIRELLAALDEVTEERDSLSNWVAATVLAVELNALDPETIKTIQHTGHELLGDE